MIDERDIEGKLFDAVKAYGGMCVKLDSGAKKGVQDRLVLLPGARVYFVETKRPEGGRLSVLQKVRRVQMRRMGFPSLVVSTQAELAEFVKSWGDLEQE